MRIPFTAATIALAGLAAPIALATPASAAAINNQDPQAFISGLSQEGFGALRGGNRAAAKVKFRDLLSQHFAIDQIGDRLIRRWKPTLKPDQLAAYQAALPNYVIGIYADRLFEYADADLKVIRSQPAANGAAVVTQVVKKGQQPITAIWSVTKTPAGYKVSNLTVAGINLALTQAADFDAYIQRNGFDKLVAFMKSKG
ncbi:MULTISPECIES: MlaC/ttg2D family ABC transporter substrate-binding protein [Sphingomonadales]|nr:MULTISPECIES: ABC transporter substrate-binding protein [Sphingomonas]AGH50331.1 toluene tolerance family protein [Sphingomonas sp. MM-1]MDX3885442.1 ABC transporter substrate-binding protein [Sphingomonas sp.]